MSLHGDDVLHRLVAELSDEEFERLYGPLARLRPTDAVSLLEGFAAPWWIVGGWAIEAFTGVERPHEDLDVCILRRDVPALVEHFAETHDVWANSSGSLTPVLSVDQRLPTDTDQLWIRSAATEPWLLDVLLAADQNGRWVFGRDPDVVLDVDQTTWLGRDGVTYQKPEIALAFKARWARPKDDADLDACWPVLDRDAQQWLGATVARIHPGHRWLGLLQP